MRMIYGLKQPNFYNDLQKQEPEEVQERDTLLIARQRLTIGASRIIINRDQALLYSGGDLSIGKTLDDQQQAVGPAKVFNNLSATIDVQGNMQLNAEESNHEDIHFSTHLVEVSRSSGGHRCGSTYYGYDTIVSETRIATHEPAKLLVGGTLTINGEHFYNRQSQVIYGVKLQGSLQGLENIDGEGKRVTERRGHSVLDTRCGLFGLGHIHREGPYYTYQDHPISLGVVIEKQGSKPDSPGSQLARRTTDFSVCALQIIHRQVDGVSVRMMTLDRLPTLPTSGLFSINGQNPQGPLIQTDPRLFSYPGRVDDFTSALIVNPSPQLPPWLGDTFYLQQLVRQQVQQLTGQRFLAGFRHDTEQCLALVLRGKELAQQPGFKIGKPLTAEQMQQLQQSVIWPIRQSFTLADGSQRWVVIPQLYAVITDTEVPSAVAMIHGHQMELQLSGKLINSGSLRTVNTLAVKAQRISNQGIIFGDRVQIQAEQDVDHQGKLLGAKQLLHVKAGVDFVAATRSHSSQVKDNRGHYSANQTVLGERSRMLVTEAGGQLLVEAGRDINLAAAQILNSGPDGSSQFISGRDINLQTVEVEQREHYQGAGEHYQGQGEQRDIGSQIKTAGDLSFQAKGQFTATAAQVASGIPINNALAALEAEGCASDSLNPVSSGRLQIQASSLALLPGRASRYREKSTQHTDKKLLNSTTRTDYQFQQQATILGCEFSGSHTELVATEGDLVVHGSKVASDHGTSLLAEQGNISITSAESHHQQITAHQEEKSGLFSEGGVSLTLGEQQHRQRQQLNGREQHSSAIGSRFGDVKIWAKQHYQQLGSHLIAPQGEVDASGATLEVRDTHHQQQLAQESHSHTSGLTIGATNPALSAWQTANQLTSTASQTSDPRMQALAAVTGGLAAKNLSDAIKTNPSQLGGVNFSVTVGESESHSHSQEQQTQAQRSQVIGRNLTVQARDGNATLQGDFQAAEQLQLSAAKDLQLLASQSQSHQQSHQSSSSHSFGVGLGSSGNGITTSLSVGKGHRQGDSTHYQLTQVSAGQKVILQSGGDTQIQGVIEARQIQGQARNLTVESLQDTDYQQGQQQQLGVSLTAGANSISGSINLNNNHYRSDYASVQQRAGLESADGGIQYRVEKNLHLSGAVMAGNEEAVKHDRIQIVAGTVTQKAIENRDDNNASSVGLGIGFSQSKNQPQTGVGKNQLGQATTGATGTRQSAP
ncbi:MAG: hemagglutinin repeat-containing protein [Candidatus Symbiodolus clandestinus]